MIDLAGVVALRAVATRGSVASAAEALGYTPSAVSQQVKRLERNVGVALLERAGRGVVLTDAGQHLVAASAVVLADLERIEADLQLAAGSEVGAGVGMAPGGAPVRPLTGEVRIGAFSTVVRGMLVEALPALRRRHPGLRVPVRESEPWETIALVASGQRDLGIVHRWGGVALAMPDDLVATPLFTDVADVVLPAGHRLAGRAALTPADLADEDWIATFDSTICRQWLRRLFDGVANAPRVVHESMEFASHLELVRAGLGVALVPRLGRGPLGEGLVAVPTAQPASTRDVAAVHRRSMAGSPALQAVLGAVVAATRDR